MTKHNTLALTGDDLPSVDRVLERAQERLRRMEEANAQIERWGPLRAAPALSRLGFRREQVAELLRGDRGRHGFAASEIEEAAQGVRRLVALRTRLQVGSLQIRIGDGYGEQGTRH